jgi:hypothetical protein
MRRGGRVAGINTPGRAGKVDFRSRQHIHIGFPQTLDRADVAPVTRKAVRHHFFAAREHTCNDVGPKVVLALRVRLVFNQIFLEFFPGKYIDAH